MRLRYTLPALADLASILDYVADRSPQGAARVHTRIRAVTDLLLRYPRAGAVTEDSTIRRMTTTPYPYLIFYEATDAEIIIHAVRHVPAILPTMHGRSEPSRSYRRGPARSPVISSRALLRSSDRALHGPVG